MGRDLTQRARTAAQNVQQDPATGARDLENSVRRMEEQFALAMPKGVEAKQLIRDAVTVLRANPKLAQVDRTSFLGSLMTCAQLGLRPGVLGHAWVLPFWNNRERRYDAQLVVGYQGLVELAHRSGRIASLIARTVYEHDTFDVDYGLSDTLVHKPALKGTRGNPVAYYAVAKFTTGGHAFIVMTQDEMLEYRDRYAMAKTREGKVFGPWVDNFEGMAHKTCVRQLAKWMPKSTDLAAAIEADGGVRLDISPDTRPEESTQHYDAIPEPAGPVIEQPADEPPAQPDPADEAWLGGEASA